MLGAARVVDAPQFFEGVEVNFMHILQTHLNPLRGRR
jgi:hypothetical protein